MEFSLRPLVQIEVSWKQSTKSFMALVDSGTDVTMMDMEIATILGITFPLAKKVEASGIGGVKPGLLNKVNIQIEGFEEIMTFGVVFVERLGFDVILGQDDFFRRFHVRFEREAKAFYLRSAL